MQTDPQTTAPTTDAPACHAPAILSVMEFQRDGVRPGPHGAIPVSRGILTIEECNGTVHMFPYISGGFGKGALPQLGAHAPLASARNVTFPGGHAIEQAANTYLQQHREGMAQIDPDNGVAVQANASVPRAMYQNLPADQLLNTFGPADSHVLAVYTVGPLQTGGHTGFQAGGADFKIHLGNPRDVTNRSGFAIHPDGDNGDMLPPISGAAMAHRDGLPDDGNNGCISLNSHDALAFQHLWRDLEQRQQAPRLLYVREHTTETLPPGIDLNRAFPNIVR